MGLGLGLISLEAAAAMEHTMRALMIFPGRRRRNPHRSHLQQKHFRDVQEDWVRVNYRERRRKAILKIHKQELRGQRRGN